MLIALYLMLALLILQGLASLVEGIRFLGFARRPVSQEPESLPTATIIAPCKGLDEDLESNVAALLKQDYPDYEVLFVVASEEDSAASVIKESLRRKPAASARLLIAGTSNQRSDKVHSLLHAIDNISKETEVIAFVDSDALVTEIWLRRLVSELLSENIGATTGYRWYLPVSGGFWSAVLSAWNGAIATTLGDHNRNFAWGGSTAIRRETFERTGIRDRWQCALSDDYTLTSAIRNAGLKIKFLPESVVISRAHCSLRELLSFTTRQVIITRVYDQTRWLTAFISHALFNVAFFGGLILLLSGAGNLPVAGSLSLIYLLGSLKGALRLQAATELLPQARNELRKLWWMYVLLWPVVSVVFLINFLVSATTRRIVWRGVEYEMKSDRETVRRSIEGEI